MRLTAATALDSLSRATDDITGVLASLDELFAEHHCQHRLALMLCSSEESGCFETIGLDCQCNALDNVGQTVTRERDDLDTVHHLTLVLELRGQDGDALLHEVIDLFLQVSILGERLLQSGDSIGSVVEHLLDVTQGILDGVKHFLDASTGNGLDTADTGSDTALADDAYHTDVARVGHMGTTAQLNRVAILDHAHMVTVFLSEECHSTHLLGLFDRHLAVFLARHGFTNHLVGQVLNLADFLGGYLTEV